MNVTAVVVTYNRLALLQECIENLRKQTRKADKLLVINNSSTDGTAEWLALQPDLEVITQPNKGGSWGFYTAFERGYRSGADWVWVMDDDTIPQPGALAALVAAAEATAGLPDNFGYFGSKVLWTDGSMHQSNLPVLDHGFKGGKSPDWYTSRGITPLMLTTFVSFFISAQAIKKVGLPIKGMFIWFDDREYVFRLRKAGFKGGFAENSTVIHKTPRSTGYDFILDSDANLWKHRYGIRNDLYVRRHYKSFGSFARNAAKHFFWHPVLILLRRKTNRWPFIQTVWKATWEGLWFNPAPDVVK